MNIILMHLRKSFEWNLEEYLIILLKHNERFIRKYAGSRWGKYIFSSHCIDIFPLCDKDLQQAKTCKYKCMKNENYVNRYRYGSHNDYCMNCWIKILEDIDLHMKPKDPPKFLKKKEAPKFLKKR
jgi:hypothetical protein